jgi:hypothetical protein
VIPVKLPGSVVAESRHSSIQSEARGVIARGCIVHDHSAGSSRSIAQ